MVCAIADAMVHSAPDATLRPPQVIWCDARGGDRIRPVSLAAHTITSGPSIRATATVVVEARNHMRTVVVGTRGTSAIPEFAGSTWVRLQYVLGLARLGLHSVWVDHIYPPRDSRRSLEYLMNRFHRTASAFGFADRYCVIVHGGERYVGMSERQLAEVAHEADVLINISGHLPKDSQLLCIPRRVYLDVDPGFTQMWAHRTDLGFDQHNYFFTIGQNVGGLDFDIPTRGMKWVPTLPPVVVELWPPQDGVSSNRFSTI